MSFSRPLYYASTKKAGLQGQHWQDLYPTLGEGGKFWLDLSGFFGLNWLVARRGEWTTPWPTEIMPGYEMPTDHGGFKKSFAEVTDQRALEIGHLIRSSGTQVALFYSGGIDSTICLCALIRNLSSEELSHVHICMNPDSIIENPNLFAKFIFGKFKLIDSSVTRYDDLLVKGFHVITADQGDSLFGTELACQLYYRHSNLLNQLSNPARQNLEGLFASGKAAEKPFREFADLIQLHFKVERNPLFARTLYERIVHNIESCGAPVHSLHDFFWWLIFNLKYMDCALRCVMSCYGGENFERALRNGIINWFHSADYQRWSMANNNNGEKIRLSLPTTYKWAGRNYIYSVDKNEWYLRHKLKIQSLANIINRYTFIVDTHSAFAMDNQFQLLRFTDPEVRRDADQSLTEFDL